MKNYLVLLLILISVTNCKAQQQSVPADTLPVWLNKKIEAFTSSNPGGEGRIEKFLYDEQTVYMVNFCVACPDNLVHIYNEEEEEVCKFGGIAGINTCPDFTDKAVSQGIVWPK